MLFSGFLYRFCAALLSVFFIALAGCDQEKQCLDCDTKLVYRAWDPFENIDSVRVAKMEGQRGWCDEENGASAQEQKAKMEERAKHHREILKAFADPDYNGFYTGARSIDTEEDLHSLLKKEPQTHPFIIRIERCDSYTEPR